MPKSERTELIRGTTVHYTRTEELLGKGGYAKVYGCNVKVRAVDHPGMVIKVFRTQYQHVRTGEPDPKVPERRAYSQTQIREAMAMKRLRGHPNVMQMHHGFICGENVESAIIMDRMDGSVIDLKNLDHGTQKDILCQILQGLDHIHKRGYIHRDMKSDNVLFKKLENGKYSVKISDFGLARLVDDAMTPRMMTVNYRAPEAHGKDGIYTKAIDIWGAGMIACELYASKRINMFVNADRYLTRGLEDVDAYIDSIIDQLDYCPSDLKLLLRSMLHKDPKQRPCIDDLLKSGWLKPYTV